MSAALRGVVAVCLAASAALAATPPDRVHYQGVLRDAAGEVLDGAYDMEFAFFTADTLGDEILIDRHVAANAQAVQVSGGMFSAPLGAGEVLDGAGPGTYASLAEVFADHGDVWLEIRVAAETLAPRLPVMASAFALNAGMLDGRPAAEFVDTSASEQGKSGKLVLGSAPGTIDPYALEVHSDWGAYFEAPNGQARAKIGAGNHNTGVRGEGTFAGGYFEDIDESAYAVVAFEHTGIQGYGNFAGGSFRDADSSGLAYLGHGNNGVTAYGTDVGGYFQDTDGSGEAYVGYGNYGIAGYGNTMGAYFQDGDGSGYARLGYGDYGMQGYGTQMGALFDDTNGSGFAYLAFGHWGLYGYGDSGGMTGVDNNSGTVGYLATGSSSTQGNGTKNFVQNHPYRDDQVIVYAAPEGNEVATYTRGTARLVSGEARIALDATFAWVTNPDIGLTAHLTPRGDGRVFVEALDTSELVVRAGKDTPPDLAFDYMVWGLRIGFEEVSVVREKGEHEMVIPSMDDDRARFTRDPALREHVALERFKSMNVALGKRAEVDLSRAHALRDAIGVFDSAVDRVGIRPEELTPGTDREQEAIDAPRPAATPVEAGGSPAAAPDPAIPPVDLGPARLRVEEPVLAGDLLTMNERGELRRALGEADRGVVGIAAEDSLAVDGGSLVSMTSSGIALLRVDADLGAIAHGDLLVSSPTPGHAMRAYASIPGTVIAKALEPLEIGRGTIRALVTPR